MSEVEMQAKELASARLGAKLQRAERQDLKARLRDLDLEDLRKEVSRLESLAGHQAYKASGTSDAAVHGMLQRRQDELAVAREVLHARTLGADDDSFGAALLIQCQIRKCLARIEMSKRRSRRKADFSDQLTQDDINESALLIQGQMRRRLARNELGRRRQRRAQGLDPCGTGSAPDARGGGGSPHPPAARLASPAPGTGDVLSALSDAAGSGTRSIPLQTAGGSLVPAFRVQDVSDVPITDNELRSIFDKIDLNGNGWIDKKEFKEFYRDLESYGIEETDDELQHLLHGYNMLGDERLAYEEFAILMLKLAQR
eukprot:TRINITY_DN13007_c0_g1_i1.p1 TRINITY_DN13007_c0_g1~~TRINITY_DN13007_c0_g1_i1.p1  ORF type:complete len:314 (+),score=131.74 TRINITY_DN13007_c0_g1_i1:64-1005(+)